MAILRDETNSGPRVQNRRGGVRVNSRFLVAVEWEENGQPFRAEAKTMDTGPQGCMIVLLQSVSVGQKVRLMNLNNHKNCEAVVIWRGEKGRAGCELGLQLRDAPYDFWEMDF